MPSETLTLSADTDRGRLHEARANLKIQPVIMIFDSRPRNTRQKHAKKSRKSSTASGKTFAFVNISRPGKVDEESRRLVKTHVMQDVLRQKSGDCSKLEVMSPTSSDLLQHSPRSMESSPQAPPSYLLIFPFQTEPYMLKLVHDYAGAMLPTESKVIDSAWFPLIMTDAALFHALLCTSALFGLHDIAVQRKHMLESIRLINGRLSGDGATSDATITAILFMAKAEYFQGNHGVWSVHMDGVKRIVELRGGMETLSQLIQQKIYSTDILGCMEIGAIPHFPAVSLPKPLCPPYHCDLPPAIASLAEIYTLDPDFLALLSEITTHAAYSSATHDTLNLQYRLLSLYSTRQYQHLLPDPNFFTGTFYGQGQEAQSDIVQEILLIGAMLFLSLPHMRTLPPIRPIDYSYLLSRLNSFLSPSFNNHTLLLHREFLLWLSFLGEVFSSSSIALSIYARGCSPFGIQMRAFSDMLGIISWEEMNMALGMMWAIQPRHEKPYRCLWEEAVIDQEYATRSSIVM
ncbi:hypothetical protein HBI92_115920 [Parastagonospora nodorum]|nr:hypothetical protein HBI90_125930 [Parastagonospora nodorum]KAH5887639.1 hypothetical protein HBI92_115920 [Parastagonospora nodorum]